MEPADEFPSLADAGVHDTTASGCGAQDIPFNSKSLILPASHARDPRAGARGEENAPQFYSRTAQKTNNDPPNSRRCSQCGMGLPKGMTFPAEKPCSFNNVQKLAAAYSLCE
jgi:hypothetical protein